MQLLVLQMGVNAFYNNVSLFPIVTVQAAFFLLFRGQYNVSLRTGRQQLIPVIFQKLPSCCILTLLPEKSTLV